MSERDGPSPWDVAAHLQPFGMLVEHRIDDVDESLIAREEAVSAGQQVTLKPPLALVLAEHFHHAPIRRQMIVLRIDFGHVASVCDLQYVLPAVGVVLVRTEQAEILAFQV